MKGILKIEVRLTQEILGRKASSSDLKEEIVDEILEQVDMIDGSNIYEYVEFEKE